MSPPSPAVGFGALESAHVGESDVAHIHKGNVTLGHLFALAVEKVEDDLRGRVHARLQHRAKHKRRVELAYWRIGSWSARRRVGRSRKGWGKE